MSKKKNKKISKFYDRMNKNLFNGDSKALTELAKKHQKRQDKSYYRGKK